LTIVCNKNLLEYTTEFIDKAAKALNVNRPEFYKVNNRDDLTKLIQKLETEDKTNEGVVLQDINGLRVKVKTSSYLALHRLANNGNIRSYKNILPLILTGEIDEVIAYFPEVQDIFLQVNEYIQFWKKHIFETYNAYKDMECQKKFALAVKDYEYASV